MPPLARGLLLVFRQPASFIAATQGGSDGSEKRLCVSLFWQLPVLQGQVQGVVGSFDLSFGGPSCDSSRHEGTHGPGASDGVRARSFSLCDGRGAWLFGLSLVRLQASLQDGSRCEQGGEAHHASIWLQASGLLLPFLSRLSSDLSGAHPGGLIDSCGHFNSSREKVDLRCEYKVGARVT